MMGIWTHALYLTQTRQNRAKQLMSWAIRDWSILSGQVLGLQLGQLQQESFNLTSLLAKSHPVQGHKILEPRVERDKYEELELFSIESYRVSELEENAARDAQDNSLQIESSVMCSFMLNQLQLYLCEFNFGIVSVEVPKHCLQRIWVTKCIQRTYKICQLIQHWDDST